MWEKKVTDELISNLNYPRSGEIFTEIKWNSDISNNIG